MDGDIFEMLGGLAEVLGLGDAVKGALRGPEAYAQGRATQTDADPKDGLPYAYERVLTRRRKLGVNDR